MENTRYISGRIELALCAALFGALTGGAYAQPGPQGVFTPPPRVEASGSAAFPGVEIRVASDFYEPLAPQGEWVDIGSYGRCWRPGHVARDWRPYCNGNWQRTDAGWYWVSDEPWGWATYHYGRWDFTDRYGWYWVPQTQWAPAWVSWHEGGGYVGWAPLQPSVSISANGFVGFSQSRIPPRAFVFVEQRRFLDPVRPSTVVVNNTTIVSKTVNITTTRVVNNTVINEGPRTQVIEQVSGRKIQAVPVRELRQKQEAPAVARQQTTAPALEKKQQSVPTPVRSQAEPVVKKTVAAPAPLPVEKPGVAPRAPAPLSPTGRVREREAAKVIPSRTEPRPNTSQPAAIKPTPSPAAKYAQPSEQPASNAEQKAPGKPVRPAKEKPIANEKNGKATGNQKAEENQTPPEKPAVPPQAPRS